MGNVMAYSGLTTKIRAMQAKLLTQADYETISGFTDVVQQKKLFRRLQIRHRMTAKRFSHPEWFQERNSLFRRYWRLYSSDLLN